ncbi:MAG: NAD-dependent epimerase/dehydratase family protein [Gemmatimonadetes bacterium]|nr:NAD-dependent epimerase/dehydratase family protein [Gemmatimonadota bacterium]
MTGATGFLGRWVEDAVARSGRSCVGAGSGDGDLRELREALRLVRAVGPETVVHLAGLGGGIGIHASRQAELLRDNALMGLQVLEACRLAGVPRVILAGSAAAYGGGATVPSPESELGEALPTGSSRPYALAKLLLGEALAGYRTQFGLKGGTLVFTNLYGPGDHFGDDAGHVVAALVPRFVAAAAAAAPAVTVWGSGRPTRDFLYVGDAARAVVKAIETELDADLPVNVGSGRETSIRALAEGLAKVTGFDGRIEWDASKPDGAPRRALDVRRAEALLGFRATTGLHDGLAATVQAYREVQRGVP